MTSRIRLTYSQTASAGPHEGRLAGAWTRAFEAAGLSLARSDGGRRGHIELGPPLPAGISGEREVLDVWLASAGEADTVWQRVAPHAPDGAVPLCSEELGDRLPSLAMLVRAAHYLVCWPADGAREAGGEAVRPPMLRERVAAFLSHPTLEWEEYRGERIRTFDLRAMVRRLEVVEPGSGDATCLAMQLVLTHDRTMRPASLLAALGIDASPASIIRTAIEVDHPRLALRAWREWGRFQ